MVMTPLLQSAYNLTFPLSRDGVQGLASIWIQLNDSNEIYVEGSKVTSDDIPKLISGRSVLFEAGDTVNYGIVLKVIDTIHHAQPRQIAIRTHNNI